MSDLTREGPPHHGPWGPRSAARALEAAERAVRSSVPPVAGPATRNAPDSQVRFSGETGAFFGLLVKGFLLQLVTLGIYRFWLTTDIRRFYWGHTTIGPDHLAYTGFGIELFKGFLIALAIIVPIQAGAFFLALGLPSAEVFISAGVIIIFLFLGQYAVYAARRYRLTRTSFRGLRLRMTGSAWSYAVKGFGLSILAILTLGLAYPWVATVLERIKMRETFYGDAAGDFVGTPGTLMRRGLAVWALAVGIPALVIVTSALAVPFAAWERMGRDLAGGQIAPMGEAATAVAAIAGGLTTAVLVPVLLFPAFQAIVFRWRMEGMRIGGAGLSCTFTVGTAYKIYILGFLAIFAVMTALSVVAAVVLGGAAAALWAGGAALGAEAAGMAGIGLLVVAYVGVFGAYWIVKQVFIDLALYRARARSLAVVNLAALDAVTAHNVDASAMGDSLGDAVDFGIGI